MRFVIAPDWLMNMKDDDLLCTKQVLDIYGYSLESRGVNTLVKKGHLPMPDRQRQQGPRRRLIFWSVRHIKNNIKLPSEIVEV